MVQEVEKFFYFNFQMNKEHLNHLKYVKTMMHVSNQMSVYANPLDHGAVFSLL